MNTHSHSHGRPVRESGSGSEQEDAVLLTTPGEGWEAAVSVELGSSEEVQVGDTPRDNDLPRVGGTHFWVCRSRE